MRLWTLQEPDFFALLEKRGVLRTDGRHIEMGPDFRPYYRWMMEEMRLRGVGTGKRYPLWFHDKKIDMRGAQGPGGRRVLRAEVEVPEERALVSDYQLWHIPLNDGYLARNEAEDDAFDEEEERRGFKRARYGIPKGAWMSPDSDYPPDLRERVLDSWGRIFPDRWHELEDGPCTCGYYSDRQAVVEELYPEDVVKGEPFVTRYGYWENQQKRKKAS